MKKIDIALKAHNVWKEIEDLVSQLPSDNGDASHIIGGYYFEPDSEFYFDDMADDIQETLASELNDRREIRLDQPSSKSAVYVLLEQGNDAPSSDLGVHMDDVEYILMEDDRDPMLHIGERKYECGNWLELFPRNPQGRLPSFCEVTDFADISITNARIIWTELRKYRDELKGKVEAELKFISRCRELVEQYATGKLSGHFSNGEAVFDRLDGDKAPLTAYYDANKS